MVSFPFESQRPAYWRPVTSCFLLLAALCGCCAVLHQKTVNTADPLQTTSESSTMADTTKQPEAAAVDLGSLLDAGEGADVTLVAGNTRLAAHRDVLAAGSPILATMFRPDTLQASSSEVNIPGLEGPVLRQLVAFLYTGRAPQLPGMAPQLLAAAERYGVSALEDASEQQVLQHLDVECAAAAAVVAVRLSRPSLVKPVIAFMKPHIFEVLDTHGWAEAVINQPREVVQIYDLLAQPPAETSATATGSTPTAAVASAAARATTAAVPAAADSASTATATATAIPNATDSASTAPAAATAAPTATTRAAATALLPTAGSHTPPPDATHITHLRSLSAKQKGRRLLEAAKQGAVEELRALLSAGADVRATDGIGITALHWAAWEGHLEAARTLLQAGAQVGARSSEWRHTPLDSAAVAGRTAVLRLLLGASADIGARNKNGLTPLHWAAGFGHAEVVRALLQAGADKRARDNEGYTAWDYARNNNHQELVQLLQ